MRKRVSKLLAEIWERPRPLELAFVLLLLAAVLVYLPVRGAFQDRAAAGKVVEHQALTEPEPPFRLADIDPEGNLVFPDSMLPISVGSAGQRNLFKYGTPPPRPTPVATPRPSTPPRKPVSRPPPPVTPTPAAPVRYKPGVTLVGLFGYASNPVVALKQVSSEAILVARAGEVVQLMKDGKVIDRIRVKRIGLDEVELEHADDARKSTTLEFSENGKRKKK